MKLKIFLIPVAIAISGVTVPASAADLPITGGSGGGPFRTVCPKGGFMTGVTVRRGGYIDQLAPACSTYETVGLNLVKSDPGPAVGGTGGSNPIAFSCGPNQVVTGLKTGYTRDGNRPQYLDYVEITCSPTSGTGLVPPACADSGDKCWDKHPNPGPYNGYGLSFRAACPPEQAVIGLIGRSGAAVDALAPSCAPRPFDPGTLPNKRAAISVGIERTQLGPAPCAKGSNFNPNLSVNITYYAAPNMLSYSSVGQGRPGPQGGFFVARGSYDKPLCRVPGDAFGNVMFVATQKDGDRVIASARAYVPAGIWCGQLGGGSSNYSCAQAAKTEAASK